MKRRRRALITVLRRFGLIPLCRRPGARRCWR